ncbi:MAG: hypothetical protein ACK5LN_11145 [Propioniciclava sp.]
MDDPSADGMLVAATLAVDDIVAVVAAAVADGVSLAELTSLDDLVSLDDVVALEDVVAADTVALAEVPCPVGDVDGSVVADGGGGGGVDGGGVEEGVDGGGGVYHGDDDGVVVTEGCGHVDGGCVDGGIRLSVCTGDGCSVVGRTTGAEVTVAGTCGLDALRRCVVAPAPVRDPGSAE